MITFPKVDHVILFGGSPLLVALAKMLIGRGLAVDIFTSSRQEAERVGRHGESLGTLLAQERIDWHIVTDDINTTLPIDIIGGRTLGIGIGEAWSFSDEILAAFEGRLLDMMGIPLPRYRGRAHYSWAIMNGATNWGCALQIVTKNTVQGEYDDGEIVFEEVYKIPFACVTPADWFDTCNNQEIDFLTRFFTIVDCGIPFDTILPEETQSLFFPALKTLENGWVNWDWDGDDITTFIQAFDNPYPGASTTLHGRTVQLKEADLFSGSFHPFCSGLVVRIEPGQVFIATRNGLLCVQAVVQDGKIINDKVKPGDRFVTSTSRLERSRYYSPNYLPSGDGA